MFKGEINRECLTEWTSTFLIMIGSLFTALDIYPMNVVILLLGTVGWAVVGLMWKKISLVIVDGFCVGFYILGLIHHFWV